MYNVTHFEIVRSVYWFIPLQTVRSKTRCTKIKRKILIAFVDSLVALFLWMILLARIENSTKCYGIFESAHQNLMTECRAVLSLCCKIGKKNWKNRSTFSLVKNHFDMGEWAKRNIFKSKLVSKCVCNQLITNFTYVWLFSDSGFMNLRRKMEHPKNVISTLILLTSLWLRS